MELIEYLNQYFLTSKQLTEQAKISATQLSEYQKNKLMPKPSYRLKVTTECNSFFGAHDEQYTVEYYPAGYLSWLGILKMESNPDVVYDIFSKRYKSTIKDLKLKGHNTLDQKLATQLDSHIKDEWQHFLDGTYGLCTRTGLPEDIAAKEFSICQINELISETDLTANQLQQLTRAVDLLDSSSALFAPHERERSSRQRLINDVRREYKL